MKAIVISIEGKSCVIMKNNGDFSRIGNKNYKIGQEITLPSRFAVRLSACAAAVLALLMTSLIILNALINNAVGYVYMDINPSFRLDVNRFGKVLEIVPLNDEAEELVSGLKLNDDSIDACIGQIVYLCELKGYIGGGENDVEISVSSSLGKLEDIVLTASKDAEKENIQISVYNISLDDNESALSENVSPRRLRAIGEYTNYLGGKFEENKEKLAEIPTDEIFELVREYRRSTKGENDKSGESDISSLSYISEKRLEALRRYTAEFGGTLEENLVLLRGLSTKEIYAEISANKRDFAD